LAWHSIRRGSQLLGVVEADEDEIVVEDTGSAAEWELSGMEHIEHPLGGLPGFEDVEGYN